MMEEGKLFAIAFSYKLGRHLIAVRDIEAGEVILDEPPIVEGPSSASPSDSPVCPVCYHRQQQLTFPCETCSLPLCSLNCSQSPRHRENECRLLIEVPQLLTILSSRNRRQDLYDFITTSRCLFLKSRNGMKWKQVLELESRAQVLESQEPSFYQVIDIAFSLLSWSSFDIVPCERESPNNFMSAVHHCLGVLRTNAFSELSQKKGVEGLYFLSSFMAHNCQMNTDRQFDSQGSRVVVRAAINISKGQPITTTYLTYLSNTEERQIKMNTDWGFSCDCLRCESLTELNTFLGSIVCPHCSNLTLCPLRNRSWKCATCEKGFSETEILELQFTTKEIQGSVPNNLENIEAVENWMLDSSSKRILHPNHSIFTQVKLYLCHAYGSKDGLSAVSDDRLLRKVSICQDLLSIVNELYKGIYLFKGV